MHTFCGCYYYVAPTSSYSPFGPQQSYLPLLDSEVHSTILATTSRTVLKQTFSNPSKQDAIKECVYMFPLYDGVSVVSFTCRIGKKVLTGLVKEKEKAKEIFDQAAAKGETAGLLEQAPESADIFSTRLGNIPAGQSIVVEITYIGELKHHDNDGIRFTIPTKIAPRYGPATSYDASTATPAARDGSGIEITVDINLEEGSFIKGVQSPSHPIAVSVGTVSTSDSDPMMSKASATLSLGSAILEKDFVLIVLCKDSGIPKALLETHPTIPNQRALMTTLVPKFSLPASRPEIVFVTDRSGSMHDNITMVVSAMNVFLKSMPSGVKFNICSFGSYHSFLWPKSQSYTKESLGVATQHLQTFIADMGGTETFGAIKATVEQRFQDIPLEIILLTDGDISRQNDLFVYVNQQVELSKGNIRVFPLGIGNGVSHSLIEGLARAGNGFAQAAQNGERLDNSIVRMLRGALSPHITDYRLEVKYEACEEIDQVTEGFKVLLSDADSIKSEKSLRSKKHSPPKATISLFDTSVDPDKEDIKGLKDSKFWLPDIPYPKLHQAPHKIPSLFAFSRTSVYLLISPDTVQRKPIAVVLRAMSSSGPLALEIPVEILAGRGETIHQLAAKKAVQDLEEGRGWIYKAKDQNGTLVKDRYPSCFEELVQREAVRLGEKFQIAGKWCSFVAVAANDEEIAQKKKKSAAESSRDTDESDDFDLDKDVQYTPSSEDHEDDGFMVVDSASAPPYPFGGRSVQATGFGSSAKSSNQNPFGAPAYGTAPLPQMQAASFFGASTQQENAVAPNQGSLFGGFGSASSTPNQGCLHRAPAQNTGSDLFRAAASAQIHTGGLFGAKPQSLRSGPFGSASPAASAAPSGGLFGNIQSQSVSSPPVPNIGHGPSNLVRGIIPSQPTSTGGLFGSQQHQQQSGIQLQPQYAGFASAPAPLTQHSGFIQPQIQSQLQNTGPSSPYNASSPQAVGQPQGSVPPSPYLYPAVYPPPMPNGILPSSRVNPYPFDAPILRKKTGKISSGAVIGSPGGVSSCTDSAAWGTGVTSDIRYPQATPQNSLFGPPGQVLTAEEQTADSMEIGSNSPSPSSTRVEAGFQAGPFVKRSGRSRVLATFNHVDPETDGSEVQAPIVRRRIRAISFSHCPYENQGHANTKPPITDWSTQSNSSKVLALINLQDFDGFWPSSSDEAQLSQVAQILGFEINKENKSDGEFTVWVTLLVVCWLEEKAREEEGTWGLVVEKARAWLDGLASIVGLVKIGIEVEARNEVRRFY